MGQFKVVIPQETYVVSEFLEQEQPGTCLANSALIDFEPKPVFGWQLSLLMELSECDEQGLPTRGETAAVEAFEAQLDQAFKGVDPAKPNALFLARVTWNKTREVVYRVYNPEIINDFLTQMIDRGDHARPYEFSIDPDIEWEKATWYLSGVHGSQQGDAANN